MYDCIIAGAGPIGSYAAGLLAKSGFKTLILEEHKEIGVPVHCTGIVNDKVIEKYCIPSNVIINKIDSVRCYFPSGAMVKLPTEITPVIVDRTLFDRHMFQYALQQGAEYALDAKVTGISRNKDRTEVIIRKGEEKIAAKVCIIASGAMSSLAVKTGFPDTGSSYQSIQADCRIKDLEGIELYLGNNIAPGSFAYGASISGELVKLGLITRNNGWEYFNRLINSQYLKDRFISLESAPRFRRMPFGTVDKTVLGRVMTLGDTASQLKTTTGGGISYGLRCAGILAQTIWEAWQERDRDFNPKVLAKYDYRWKQELKTELSAGLMLRLFLEKMDDYWWDLIPNALEIPQIKKIIAEHDDFDCHSRFITKFFRSWNPGRFVFSIMEGFVRPQLEIENKKNKNNMDSFLTDVSKSSHVRCT